MRKSEEFYEVLRQEGLTEKITGNPDPDYTEAFYQQIFGNNILL